MSTLSHRPSWRQIIPDDWSKGVTVGEYWEQVGRYAELAIEAATNDVTRLVKLVERLDDLPPPAHEQLLDHLRSDELLDMPDAVRLKLWNELTDLVTRHRKYVDAEWAMSPEQVEKITEIARRLQPEDPALRYQRMFSERELDLYEGTGDWEDQQRRLDERREEAVAEIAALGGSESLLKFGETVESPWRAGLASGILESEELDRVFFPDLLDIATGPRAQFAAGFARGRLRSRGWEWVDAINKEVWTREQIGQFLASLPFTAEAWARSAQLLGRDESTYWSKTPANAFEAKSGLEGAVDRLIEHGRPIAAIGCLSKMVHTKESFDSRRAVRALLAGVSSSEKGGRVSSYDVAEIIKALQSDPDTNQENLYQVEFAYLAILDGHHGASAKSLEWRLAKDPKFFCEVIRLIFRSRKEDQPQDSTEEKKNIAAHAYRLLTNWTIPPGSQVDGEYDGEALATWLDAVKMESEETGHLEVSMTMVGHALTHTPGDPDGLWINRAAAAALNAQDADDMRDGFRTELFNSRGVHGFTSGEAERALAENYRVQAAEVERDGFHRLATTLRDLAASYERQSERESVRDPLDD